MYQLSILYKNEKIYTKYYNQINIETRRSYITYLNRVVKEIRLLQQVKFYAKDYIEKNINPWDDDFTFNQEKVYIYGMNLGNYIYEYKFKLNNLELILVYTSDDINARKEFINEINDYLKVNQRYNEYEFIQPYLKEFRVIDNDYITVEKIKITNLKNDY